MSNHIFEHWTFQFNNCTLFKLVKYILHNFWSKDLKIYFQINHSHQRRKESLETRTEPAFFSLGLEFRKFLEPSPREPEWDINKKVWETLEKFKIKGLSSCSVLNLRMPGENWWIFNCHSCRVAPEISFFRVTTKDDKQSTNWGSNIVTVITRDRVIDGDLKGQIKNRTLHTCEPQEKKWYVVCNAFLLNCVFHYISNWSKVFELYLTCFFTMKSKIQKFSRRLSSSLCSFIYT